MTSWLQQPLTVSVDGPTGQTSTTFARPFVRIGSDPDSDVVLQSEGISRRAAYLHATPSGIFAVRLQSTRRRTSSLTGQWLSTDDQLWVGPFQLIVSTPEAQDLVVPDCSLLEEDGQTPCRSHFEVFCRDKLVGLRSFAASLVFVGRAPQCSLQLKGQNVSKFHCVLYREEDRVWCVDLLSSNGTLLNGSPIVAEELQPADVLDIGEFSLVYRGCQPNSVRLVADAPSVALPALAAATESVPYETTLTGGEFNSHSEIFAQAERELEAARELTEQNQLLHTELQAALEELAFQKNKVQAELERLAVERESLEAERRQLEADRKADTDQADEPEQVAVTAQVVVPEKEPGIELPSAPIFDTVEISAPSASTTVETKSVAATQPPETPAFSEDAYESVEAVQTQERPAPSGASEVALAKKKERDDLATLVLDRLEEPSLARRRALMLWTSVSLTLITAAALGWLIYLKMFADSEV